MAFRERATASHRRMIWVITLLSVLVLVVLGYVYRRFLLSGLDLVAEGTGGRSTAILCLALGLVALTLIAIWLLLPIFLFFGFRDLRRRTAELDRTTRLCARHLAQLAANDQAPATPVAPDPKSPNAEAKTLSHP
jgi:hypothetical protein